MKLATIPFGIMGVGWRKRLTNALYPDALAGQYASRWIHYFSALVAPNFRQFPFEADFLMLDYPRLSGVDRIYVSIPYPVIERLFALSEGENHCSLRKMHEEQWMGYCEGRTDQFDAWLRKHLSEWTATEYDLLMRATIESFAGSFEDWQREAEHQIYEEVIWTAPPKNALPISPDNSVFRALD